ncbi:hypothetical protein [Arthrospira platensis]|uniref:Uncharacterized protein n=1 Tax=Limnospira platensis NIES-46 TaxID=1236695 RepID=A0A5M3TCW7_LIMPL|nr:hypothetical protein [Arthrospira platensis]AMW28680.1 hypothetical protein AP285_12595 [Arthrospira platensis YZ]KDR56179.1 hypothetical protein APPUASWS_018080 [Arthrospira platensis str. Paraca]MBD2711748.1 hypothetical protein [Arthrospira platensis FACHB-835]MDF2210477.1 hypothetical protein [Arthrospira platensis NCB002]MDT9184279.1 hypothetical protein [Limnospira sp. PMC 289.06]MDT9296451.1 hypothetical protein [Arthrospira platensis PCC 7345]MDT9312126.1 hypothetical protein [Lim
MLVTYSLTLNYKAYKQLKALPLKSQQRYSKAFDLLQNFGAKYPSLRTHRYYQNGKVIWSSSASMALRFYWDYTALRSIEVIGLDSH